ncbi:spore germination protein [Paenibacillus thermoaerophilus]|uniref:Spore germination protein n=1 Tax=Paenibacillus thermoaerophilus TaxID=1215385 RepID=A0ABW2V521_9BACL|nr:spore germination protein [Paenibacillus thermoaerophilus]
MRKSKRNDARSQDVDFIKPLSASLSRNLRKIGQTLGNSADIVIREVRVGQTGDNRIAYTDGLTDTKAVSEFILETVMLDMNRMEFAEPEPRFSFNPLQFLKDRAVTIGDIRDIADYGSLFNALLSGDTIVLVDGQAEGIAAGARNWKDRGVKEAAAESVVRGPREGFSEADSLSPVGRVVLAVGFVRAP